MKHFFKIGNKVSFTEWVVNDVKKGLIGKPLYFDSMMQAQPLQQGLRRRGNPKQPYTQESQVRKWLCREYPMFVTAPEFPLKGIERYYNNPVDVWIDRYNNLVEEENMTDYGAKEQIKSEIEVQRRSVLMEKSLLSEQAMSMGMRAVDSVEQMNNHFNSSPEKKHLENMYRLQREQQHWELRTKAHRALGMSHPLVEEDRLDYFDFKESLESETIQMNDGMVTGDDEYKKIIKEQAESKNSGDDRPKIPLSEVWGSDGERVKVEHLVEGGQEGGLGFGEDVEGEAGGSGGWGAGEGGVKKGLLQPLDLPAGITKEQLDDFVQTYPELKTAFGFPVEKGKTDPFVLQAYALGNNPNPSEWPRYLQDEFDRKVVKASSDKEAEIALNHLMTKVISEAKEHPERFTRSPSKFSTGPEEAKYLENYFAHQKRDEAYLTNKHLSDPLGRPISSPLGPKEGQEGRVLVGDEQEQTERKMGFYTGDVSELLKEGGEGGEGGKYLKLEGDDEDWEGGLSDEEFDSDAEDWFEAGNKE